MRDHLSALDTASVEPPYHVIRHQRIDIDEREALPDIDAADLTAGDGGLARDRPQQITWSCPVSLSDPYEDPGRTATTARSGASSADATAP